MPSPSKRPRATPCCVAPGLRPGEGYDGRRSGCCFRVPEGRVGKDHLVGAHRCGGGAGRRWTRRADRYRPSGVSGEMVECAGGVDAGLCPGFARRTGCLSRSSEEHWFQADRHRYAAGCHADDRACCEARRSCRCADAPQPARSARRRSDSRYRGQPGQGARIRRQLGDPRARVSRPRRRSPCRSMAWLRR